MAPIEQDLVGREFPATPPREVTEDHVRAFATAVGDGWELGRPVPPTYPVVVAFDAMQAFLAEVGADLSRIVHGEQRFSYSRAVRPGDVLTATLSVTSVRSIGGQDIVGTTSVVHAADGDVVCTAGATLVHRGDAS